MWRPFLTHGCNYPWSTDGTTVFYALDFGVNVWGSHLGVTTRRVAIDADFARLASLGFTVVRWFLFGDGRSGIVYDRRGLPTSLDERVFPDLDAAIEIAAGHGIRLVLVFLDHRWWFDGLSDSIADPVTGLLFDAKLPAGRGESLRLAEGREGLLLRVVLPIVERYGPGGRRADLSAHVLGYELINEADFIVEEWERDLSPRVSCPLLFEQLGELVTGFSRIVHAYSNAVTTMGCARFHNLWAWDDPALGLDVLQLHTYPDVSHPDRDTDIFGMPASALGVRRPVVLGEFPADAPARHPAGMSPPEWTMGEYLQLGVDGGYLGAWPWSFSGTDDYGSLQEEPLWAFAREYPALVNPRCRALGERRDGERRDG